MTSSPLRPGASLQDELAYYKRQYEQLETDLADFQASSKELEEQLERDIDAAEKKERKLKEHVEKLGFEVEEWKNKHKQSKTESNTAQNALQKEITSMRETNRGLSMRLRDIEVANDDYERQARNTTSSLEDYESKLSVSIERSVLLEEEVKISEAEREALRIENQRLRDELGDLKVESEITLEKLRLAGKTIDTLRTRKPGNLAVQSLRATSPGSEASGRITPYSPTMSTPPPKSDTTSDMPTPPSPPLSDEAANPKVEPRTPLPMKRPATAEATPRPLTRPLVSRHSRGPSLASNTSAQTTDVRSARTPMNRGKIVSPTGGLPRSESLYQVKNLRLRMQKIEERVQSARSKLPARDTTPKASPRTDTGVPSSVTVRRTSKRESSILGANQMENGQHARRESQSQVKRLSYGIPRPASRTSMGGDRPSSRMSMLDRPSNTSRPASRISLANGSATRPESQASVSHDSGVDSRPRSSMSGSVNGYTAGTPRSHRPSASISELRRRADGQELGNPSASRRTTLDKASALPTPGTFTRRQSGTLASAFSRRTSVPGSVDTSMKPPPARQKIIRDDIDDSALGETY